MMPVRPIYRGRSLFLKKIIWTGITGITGINLEMTSSYEKTEYRHQPASTGIKPPIVDNFCPIFCHFGA